jgi:inosine/xanthosine triphosphate pyrophosphatase family protein
MWDALSVDEFLKTIATSGEGAIARAVGGYCAGMSVRTFVDESHGKIGAAPRGSRTFYWDPVFCPDEGVA